MNDISDQAPARIKVKRGILGKISSAVEEHRKAGHRVSRQMWHISLIKIDSYIIYQEKAVTYQILYLDSHAKEPWFLTNKLGELSTTM